MSFSRNNIVKLFFIFLLIFCLRLPFSNKAVINWDESVYFTVAQDLTSGGSMYQTSWDHKGPILYFLFVPIIKLFGNSIFVLRIYTTFYLLISMFFVYLIAKRILGYDMAWVPPLVYGLSFMKFQGLASHTEIFMMLPAIIAAYSFLCYIQNQKYSSLMLFLCGLFSATAILIKPSSLFTVIMFPAVLVFRKIKSKQYRLATFTKDIIVYLFGFGILTFTVLSYFIAHNSLTELYDSYIVFNYKYVHSVAFSTGIKNLFFVLAKASISDVITILTLISALFIAVKRQALNNQRNLLIFLICLTLVSLIGVFWGRNMWPNYYLQMALPYSFLIGLAALLFAKQKYLNANRIILIFLLVLIVNYRSIARIFEVAQDYENQKNCAEYKVADFVKKNTSGRDTIFVLGGQPVIYFLSERHAPTKYFHWIYHFARWEEILKIKEQTLSVFLKAKPKYIVYRKRGQEVKYLENFMINNYHPAKVFGDYTIFEVNSTN